MEKKERLRKIEKLRAFLEKEYPDMQIFNCRNNVGDEMETVYRDGRISVDYAVVEKYIEVFGLTNAEYESLIGVDMWGNPLPKKPAASRIGREQGESKSEGKDVREEESKALGWRIDEHNNPEEISPGFSLEELEYLKGIGLWFNTKEETELAIRKLKAWKRLKDGGFEFNGIGFDEHGMLYVKTNLHITDLNAMENPDLEPRLNLLFGGEG